MNPEFSGLQKGYTVYDVEGKKIGQIEEVTPTYFTIRQGLIFKKDIYVPTAAISRLRGQDLYLTAPQGDIDALGWDTPPAAEGRPVLGWQTIRRIPYDSETAPLVERVFSKETLRIPVRGEEVSVEKTPVITGEVAVTKELATERATVETTLRRTEVQVEGQTDQQSGLAPEQRGSERR